MDKKHPKKEEDFLKVWSKVVAKAWHDDLFKQRLLSNPKKALEEFGVHFSGQLKVMEEHNSEPVAYLSLPKRPNKELEEKVLRELAAGFGSGHPGRSGLGGGGPLTQ